MTGSLEDVDGNRGVVLRGRVAPGAASRRHGPDAPVHAIASLPAAVVRTIEDPEHGRFARTVLIMQMLTHRMPFGN
ncbi:hypothetical protein CS379_18730 [Methylobacterium frigidaeris]|jgi:hypothetical protein|nr:hypothetical protein CS379_18730 [Methylobacterium frigidaeris]